MSPATTHPLATAQKPGVWSPSFSCDSAVATPAGSRTGATVFGKNSDRPAGESQPLRHRARRTASDAPLQLAYVAIADADAHAHLGSAPFWCWGYESGVNEHRVAIGNEAIFTRTLRSSIDAAGRGDHPEHGILGMELVRLGLERGATAREALDVMTTLLEEHGQWGSGAFGKDAAAGAYDNSFLIADPAEAWILETVDRDWVARRADATDSISNEPSTRTTYDFASAGLVARAQREGWATGDALDFAAAYTDPLVPLQVSRIRQARSAQLLADARADGGVDVAAMQRVLRDHLEGTFLGTPAFDAAHPDFLTLCMHEAPSGFTWGNTASSLVAELHADAAELPVVWWGAVTPCTTIYVPIVLGAALHDDLATPGERDVAAPETYARDPFDAASYWWRTQRVLDAARTSGRFAAVQAALRDALDPVQASAEAEVDALRAAWRRGDDDVLARAAALTAAVIAQVDEATTGVLDAAGIEPTVDERWR